MDKLTLQLSKETRDERRPSKHPGHSQAGLNMFGDAEIIPPTLTVLPHFKSSNKNARDFLPPGSQSLSVFLLLSWPL